MSDTHRIRPELPELPERMRGLHVSDRGYPVPWFVAWMDEEQNAVPPGEGTPDFRVLHPTAIIDAWKYKTCWLCGTSLGAHKTFVIGPMCAVNRISSEPPCHIACARYAATACPFLVRPHARRRDDNLPDGHVAGVAILRNPGVTLLWTTKKPSPVSDGRGGTLFDIGDPEHVEWYAEGREATREEIMHSIETGLPELQKVAEQQGRGATRQLESQYKRALTLVPA
jgi:hypothetical protein